MPQKKLDRYKGPLSAEQVAEGINAATANAARLAEDANLLLSKGRFPSATSLAILAIEEAGKVAILRTLALARTDAVNNGLDGRQCLQGHLKLHPD